MDVRITSRHDIKISASTQDVIREKIEKLERFFNAIPSAHAVIDEEGTDKTVEVTLQVHDHTVNAKSRGATIGKALSETISRVERQLKKINERMKNHKPGNGKPHETQGPEPENVDEYAEIE